MIQMGQEDPSAQMILLHLDLQAPLVALMVQADRKVLVVQRNLQAQAHLSLQLFPAHRCFLLVQAVLVDQEILAHPMDQESQVDLEAL